MGLLPFVLTVAVGATPHEVPVGAGARGSARTAEATARWSIERVPRPAGAMRALLTAVSCVPRSSTCLAVGYSATPSGRERTLAEVRSGRDWAIRATPDRAGSIASVLNGVSCPSAHACVAVGTSTNASEVQWVLSEIWDGRGWLVRVPPIPPGAREAELSDVWCASASSCVAVGSYTSRQRIQSTLVERWNGRSWRRQWSPDATGAVASTFHAVTCRSPSSCEAVGYDVTSASSTVPLAEGWRGRSWAIQPTPAPVGRGPSRWGELNGASCTSTTACMAVGDFGQSAERPYSAMSEAWNGRSWRVVLPPPPAGSARSPLLGVSCAPTWCLAVGSALVGARTVTLGERWSSASWRVEATPTPRGALVAELADVACAPSGACVAVGFAGTGGLDQAMAASTSP